MNNVNSISVFYTDKLTPAFDFVGSVNVPIVTFSLQYFEVLDKQEKNYCDFKESLISLFLNQKKIKELANDDDFFQNVENKNKVFNEDFSTLQNLIKLPCFKFAYDNSLQNKLITVYRELADLKALSENLYKEMRFIRDKEIKKTYKSNIDLYEILEVADKIECEINKYKE
ncbi:hypothetical protein ACWIW6_09940 [Ursidibacter sp. B-7004-1]